VTVNKKKNRRAWILPAQCTKIHKVQSYFATDRLMAQLGDPEGAWEPPEQAASSGNGSWG